MTTQIWKHNTSGDKFGVETDSKGNVIAAIGPLHHTELDTTKWPEGIVISNGDPEDAKWIRDNRDNFSPAK
jgi:uncharacterized protein RhaS with RHS repeats